jgi:hypothetical protein
VLVIIRIAVWIPGLQAGKETPRHLPRNIGSTSRAARQELGRTALTGSPPDELRLALLDESAYSFASVLRRAERGHLALLDGQAAG